MPGRIKKIFKRQQGFTLAEMIITVGILIVLTSAAALIINPIEYFKQSRDVQRMSDLKNLQTAVERYKYSGSRIGSLGSVNTIYISLVGGNSSCTNLELPSLVGGWSYYCVTSQASLQNIDGTGWIPVNLSGVGSLSTLPIDPTNNLSYFYAYAVNSSGQIEFIAGLESQKYLLSAAASDKGRDSTHFESGEDLTLWGQAYGL